MEKTADVIEHYETALRGSGRIVEFDISGLDRLGVPVTSCSLVADGRFVAQGNGYGRDAESARIGGLGELAEGVLSAASMPELLRDAIDGSYRELLRTQGADRVADPRLLGLPAGSPYDEGMPLTWVPTTRVRTGETVYAPADFVASEPGQAGDRHPLITSVTNGLGAGRDDARAISHGIGEILQRHTNGLRFRALDRRSPEIAEATLPASVRDLAGRMREAGVEPVFKHAASELGVVSTYVMGVDDDDEEPIRLAGCGEAAHPSAEVSLTKALLEFANSRARKAFFFGREQRRFGRAEYWDAVDARTDPGETRAREALAAWARLDVGALRRLTAPHRVRTVAYDDIVLGDLPDLSRQEDLLDHYLRALSGRTPHHDVLAVTTVRGGVTAAKVLVTGLEVEILSYGRIGELGCRNSLEGDLDLVRIGEPSDTHRDRVLLTSEAEERLGGPVFYSYETAARIVGDLYPLYREPPRHSLVV